MAKAQAKSPLMARYGAKLDAAVKQHADAPIELGRQQVPAGITNGIARLTKCYFGQYKTGDNQGEFFFRAEGVVVEPGSITDAKGNEIEVEGMVTSIMEPVCATKKSDGTIVEVDEHVRRIENEMKKLGIPGESFTGGDVLEELAAALQEAKPYFRFSTSTRKAMKPGDPDGVWENWYGTKGLEDFVPESSDDVEDSTGASEGSEEFNEFEEPETESEPEPTPPKKSAVAKTQITKPQAIAPTKPAPGRKPATKPAPEPEPEEAPGLEEMDIEEVLAMANDNDDSAIEEIVRRATEAGIDDTAINNADSWESVVKMIQKSGDDDSGDGDGEEDSEESEWAPESGEIYNYRPVDPKTKKPGKPVEVRVGLVDADAQTVTLVDVATKKPITDPKTKRPANIPWDALESAE